MGICIANKIKFKTAFNWATWWASHLYDEADLLLKFDSRSGNTLVDSISGETATILTPELLPTPTEYLSGDKTRADELLWDGNDHTIYFRMKLMVDLGANAFYATICELGSTGTTRGMRVSFYYKAFRCQMSDGPTDVTALISSPISDTVYALDFADILITINATTKELIVTIYNPAGVSIGTHTESFAAFTLDATQNNANWRFNSDETLITNLKKFKAIKTLSQCLDDTYITDLRIHYPNLLSSIDISGNANYLLQTGTITEANVRYISFNTWALDYGFDRLQKLTGGFNVYSCYTAAGGKTDSTIPMGVRLIGENEGNLTKHNSMTSKIRFTNAFFDRSNATIWNDACRAATYYDAVNTKDFHSYELNYRTIYGYLNDNYRGRFYPHWTLGSIEKFDRELSIIEGIYLYSTDHKGTANRNILCYTKDIKCAVLNGTAITYDDENYVKIGILQATKPMLTFRIDDGGDTTFTQWESYFTNIGATPVICLITDSMGTAGFMTWDQARTLYGLGWEIAFHSDTYDRDYNSITEYLLLESGLTDGKIDFAAQSLPCDYFCGHRYSSANPGADYLTNKLGYKAHLSGYIYGEGGINGANPVALNKFRLCGMPIDTFVDYNLDVVDATVPIANLKAQIDLCVANNQWGIVYMHTYVARVATSLTEVINYALSQGVEIVNLEDAIADLKYL